MKILPIKPGAQLRLVVDNVRDLDRERHEDMTRDEYASLMSAFSGRLVEPHQAHGQWSGDCA